MEILVGIPLSSTAAPPEFQLALALTREFRGGFTLRPIALEFIRSQNEAESFIEDVLKLLARLRSRFQVKLDLSPRSLRALDAFGKRIKWVEGTALDRELVLELAAYYGEVVRRNLDGRWEISTTHGAATPLVALPNPLTAEDPFVRVVKLLEDKTPLFDWYQAFVSQPINRFT